MTIHANAPPGPKGRATLVRRIREAARKWAGRYRPWSRVAAAGLGSDLATEGGGGPAWIKYQVSVAGSARKYVPHEMEPRMSTLERQQEEMRELDAEDRASAIERLDLEQAYERSGDPRRYSDWLAERRRLDDLASLGIERQQLPDPYREALGPTRAELLERQIEDQLMKIATSTPSREELAADARGFGAAARALNQELSRHVAQLEQSREDLDEELAKARRLEFDLADTAELLESDDERTRALADAEAQRAVTEALAQSRNAAATELAELSTRPDHPDRWIEQHGEEFVNARAATREFRRHLERAASTSERTHDELRGATSAHEVQRDANPVREVPDVGIDPF